MAEIAMLIILIIVLNYQMEKYGLHFSDSPLKNGVMNVELLIREDIYLRNKTLKVQALNSKI